MAEIQWTDHNRAKNGLLVNVLEKEEETRVFFGVALSEDKPQDYTPSFDEAAIKETKERWERKTGHVLVRFYYDPMAGGLAPVVPVTQQLYKTGVVRQPSAPFGTAPNQGKVGDVVWDKDANDGQGGPLIMRSNIQRGQNTMRAVGLWVGEWL